MKIYTKQTQDMPQKEMLIIRYKSIDFNWLLNCFVLLRRFMTLSYEFQKSLSTVSIGMVFLCFVYAIIVGISCRVVVGLNMCQCVVKY